MQLPNLFTVSAGPTDRESTEVLLDNGKVCIERIVSRGVASPAGFWYDQPGAEWVTLLMGTAAIGYKDGEIVQLCAGDHVCIPAHRKHRVDRVSADAVWLAVHCG